MNAHNPYAPPRGAVHDMAGEGLELAGRGARLLAAILDGIIAGLMIYVPALIVLATTGSLEDAGESGTMLATAGLLCLIGFISWAWITALLVARYGQTMGKRVLEIRVLRSDGSQASLGRIFWLRNVVNILLGVIPLYSIIDVLLIFATLFGSVLALDLRLLGCWRRVPLAALETPTLTLAACGFGIAVASGIALISTNGTEYVGNPFLPIKFSAIGLGVANVVAVQFLPVWRRRAAEPHRARERLALGVIGGISLACWLVAVAAGRMIGYW